MRVVIAGAGNVGTYLAADLSGRHHQVVIIEQSADIVARGKATVPGATWIHGDSCEPWVLDKADLARAEVMVAATGDDEDNLVICLLAKQEFAVPRVIARVNHPKNHWLFDGSWGVDVAMSPPHILTSLVEEQVTVGDVVRLLPLEHGQVALVELTLPADSPAAGKHIYDLRLPHDSALVAIVRDGHVVIPQLETPLAAGDELLAITTPLAEETLRRAILGTDPR
ncbi:MAG: TrkA family potassium uptake protein [Acidobacteria bacterium]|nr:TrkA family potassium uptake protein [Acidobacteriota bacterium]